MLSFFNKKTNVASLKEGEVQILEGKVVARHELTVPGTSSKCVLYNVLTEAWQHGPRGSGRKMWVPSNAQQGCDGFFLDDGTGKVWISGVPNEIELSGGNQETGKLGKKGTRRYMAKTVCAGDTVKVCGIVAQPRGAEPGEGLVIRPGKKGVLKISFKRKAN